MPKDLHKNTYGIEKEYRLSKVAKVSSFMYGQDDINIVYNDALKQDEIIQNDSFSVLVANPPYSVKGFLETLSDEERKEFELTKSIEEKSYIECFFIEKAKQLLKADGVAGIVLPSSILSKGDGVNTYVQTREIIIRYFDIIAIAEFGSGTFGKTGTNTVTLFLKRKNNNPDIQKHLKYMVASWFKGDFSTNELFQDKDLLENYCSHVGIDFEIYKSFLQNVKNEELFKKEIFEEYKSSYDKSSQANKKKTTLINYIRAIEEDKLYYFCLASLNKKEVIIVKAPSDGKENKKFLGYGWSGRKGDEGIQYSGGNLNTIQTPLYNPSDKKDENRINSLIARNFSDEKVEIPESLVKFVSKARLIDMLDFSRVEFNKALSLNPNKKIEIIGRSEWQRKLGDVVDVLIGGTPARANSEYFNGNNLWVSISEMNGNIISETKEKITEDGIKKSNVKLIPKGTTLLSFKLSIGKTAIAGKDLYTNEAIAGLVPKTHEIRNDYLFHLFNGKIIDLEKDNFNTFGKSLNSAFLRNEVKIPLPPPNIQKDIAIECQKVDDEVLKANEIIEKSKISIDNCFQDILSKADTTFKLSDEKVFNAFIGRRVLQKGITKDESGIPIYSANVFDIFGYINKEFIKDFSLPSVLWGIDGNWMVNYMPENKPFFPTDHCGVIHIKNDEIHPKYLTWALYRAGKEVKFSRTYRASTARVKGIIIKAPSKTIQDDIVLKIEKLETKMNEAKKVVDASKKLKEEILRKYL